MARPLLAINDLLPTATSGGGCHLVVPSFEAGVRNPLGSFTFEKEQVPIAHGAPAKGGLPSLPT